MKLMIIEDDKSVAKVLSEFFRVSGYDCDVYNDPAEGVSAVKAGSYDVVFTDIMMPGMDGIRVLESIRSWDSSIRVIIMTGFADVDNAIEAVNNGAYAFFRKPLEIKDLIGTLKQIETEISKEKEAGALESDLFNLCMEFKDFEQSMREGSNEIFRHKRDTD